MTFCIMDTGCVVYDRRQHLPGLAYSAPLCQGCRDRLRGDLNGLRYDYVDLTQLLPAAPAPGELGKIFRPKPESKPNINMAALGLRGDIAWLVAVVATCLRRRAGMQHTYTPSPVREGYRLDHDVRYLVERTDDIASLPALNGHWDAEKDHPEVLDGVQVVQRLSGLHSRARKMCGTEPKTMTVPGFCSGCGTPSLRRHDVDTDKIWCVHCPGRWNAADYGRMVRLQPPVTGV
jgi:hypothetical protein